MRAGRFLAVVVAVASLSCGREPVASTPRAPAVFVTSSDPLLTPTVGGTAGTWRVLVTDSSGTPIPGVLVSFAPVVGNGSVSRAAMHTTDQGEAWTTLRVGTFAGAYQFRAVTSGLPPLTSPTITANPQMMRSLTPSARVVRFPVGSDSAIVAFTPRDSFGNAVAVQVGTQVTLVSRNPALVSVTNASPQIAYIRAIARPGQTWVVGAYDGYLDSVQVSVFDASATPCTFVASPVALAVGQTLAADGRLAACMKTATSAEFVFVAHYNTSVANAMATSSLSGVGVVLPAPYPASALLSRREASDVPDVPIDVGFERSLRERERQIESRAAGARAWYRSQPAALAAQPREGDVVAVNVNARDFCANPAFADMRVAAVSDAAVILHDLANPAGGFTDAEYRDIARTVDTLIYPVDTAAFGAPTDVDRNGRIAIVYSKAVNALTARTSTSTVLGFFYSRDLLPRFGSVDCPGSNGGELFYVLVPDPAGEVSAPRTKAFVQNVTLGTIAHELQHLINASRRLYVNDAHVVGEEAWLNEGLSHIAEELAFYRASGRAPRQNIGAADLANAATRAAFDQYQSNNFRRYVEYLKVPDAGSPIASNDMLSTRGAAWALLRYLADRARPADGDFWRRLANSKTNGIRNVDEVLTGTGLTVVSALRDWSVAVVLDDLAGGTGVLGQPSWHFVSAFPQVGYTEWLAPTAIVAGANLQTLIRGGSSAYARFATAGGQEALIQAAAPGGTSITGMRYTIVRIK